LKCISLISGTISFIVSSIILFFIFDSLFAHSNDILVDINNTHVAIQNINHAVAVAIHTDAIVAKDISATNNHKIPFNAGFASSNLFIISCSSLWSTSFHD